MQFSPARSAIIALGLIAALAVALSPLYAGLGDSSLVGPAVGVALLLGCSYRLLGLEPNSISRGRERLGRLATASLITALLVLATCMIAGRISQHVGDCEGPHDCQVETVVLALTMVALISLPISGFALLVSRSKPRSKPSQ